MKIKIVKLIDSNQYIFENKPYGAVDVRTSESETEEEKQAAIKSLRSFNYAVDDKNILRLVTICEKETIEKAQLDSELLFEETIDLLKLQPITKIKDCDGAGYWVDMDTGDTNPFLKTIDTQIPFFDHVYQTSLGAYSPMFSEQVISSNRGIEAVEAFIRSIHWYNKSESQTRLYLKFLYKWIAIETITKNSVDEDIIPKLCLALCIMLSKYKKIIPNCNSEKLILINKNKNYKRIIRDEFYKCRKIRNDIVHSGFKETNLINENMKLKLYLINSAYSCMIKTIEKIIISGKDTLEEIWDVMHEFVIQDELLINWVSQTFFQQMDIIITNKDEELYNDMF